MRKAICIIMAAMMIFGVCSIGGCGKDDAPDTTDWQTLYDMALRCIEGGDYEKALDLITQAIMLSPNSAQCYKTRAAVYVSLYDGDYEYLYNAISDYEQTIVLGDAAVEVFEALIDLYIMTGDEEAAYDAAQRGADATGDAGLKEQSKQLKPEKPESPENEPEPPTEEHEKDNEPEPEEEQEQPQLPEEETALELSYDEQYELNIFLSNFSEQTFVLYDRQITDAATLLQFAYIHCKINEYSSVGVRTYDSGEYAGSYYTLTSETANAKLERFFGVTLSPQEGDTYQYGGMMIRYYNGEYLFPAADGDTYPFMTVADRIVAGDDGTYEVEFTVYSLLPGHEHDPINHDFYYHTPEEAASNPELQYCYKGVAVLTPYVYNGRDTYQIQYYDVR